MNRFVRSMASVATHPPTSNKHWALPICFLGMNGSNEWHDWITNLTQDGYECTTVDFTLTKPVTIASLSDELRCSISEQLMPPPLLISSRFTTLIAQKYVSSHPLAALLLHQPIDPATAHTEYPILAEPVPKFRYEPNLAIGILQDRSVITDSRLQASEWVTELCGSVDSNGYELVRKWMDLNV